MKFYKCIFIVLFLFSIANYLGCSNNDINLTEQVDEAINEPIQIIQSSPEEIIETEGNGNIEDPNYEVIESSHDEILSWEVVIHFGEKPVSLEGDYSGQLKNGVPHGYGEWIESGADRRYTYISVTGDWEDGILQGRGKFSHQQKDIAENIYEGEWAKGLWHGRGNYTSHDGFIIEGLWANNDLVSITNTTDELVSNDIRIKINDFKRSNRYYNDPILNCLGLTRKEIIDRHKVPNRIVPYYYGFAGWGGGLCDYYWYDDIKVLFGFIGSINENYFSYVDHIVLLPGANILGVKLGKTNINEITIMLGEPEYLDYNYGAALYLINSDKRESDHMDGLQIWFYMDDNDIPAYAEISADNLRYYIDELQ